MERYEETGQRVFVFNDQVFELGIANTVTLTPIHISIGYREVANPSLVGYLGAGVGWYTYKEESAFADPQDNVDEQAVGYHVLGGVETPILPWFWLGGEFQWAYVPNVLGDQGVFGLARRRRPGRIHRAAEALVWLLIGIPEWWSVLFGHSRSLRPS